MEGKHGPVAVTLAYGALTCAGEALATLLFSTLLKTQLFTPVIIIFFSYIIRLLFRFFFSFIFFNSQFCLDSGFQTVKFVKLYLSFCSLKICLYFFLWSMLTCADLFIFFNLKKKFPNLCRVFVPVYLRVRSKLRRSVEGGFLGVFGRDR